MSKWLKWQKRKAWCQVEHLIFEQRRRGTRQSEERAASTWTLDYRLVKMSVWKDLTLMLSNDIGIMVAFWRCSSSITEELGSDAIKEKEFWMITFYEKMLLLDPLSILWPLALILCLLLLLTWIQELASYSYFSKSSTTRIVITFSSNDAKCLFDIFIVLRHVLPSANTRSKNYTMAPPSLATTVAGIRLKTCIYNASGPRTGSSAALARITASESGGVLAKSATLEAQTGNPQPRWVMWSLIGNRSLFYVSESLTCLMNEWLAAFYSF